MPLAPPAVDMLRRLHQSNKTGLVFPGRVKGKPIANTAFLMRLKRDGVEATGHGFRSSFRDWCAETGVARDVAEACLAHAVAGNATEAAYLRSDILDRRREAMTAWAVYVCGASAESSADAA